MARTSTETTPETTVEYGPLGPSKWVVINRPQGNTDSHLFIGFNDFERQVKFDTPVKLPQGVINHINSIRHVEFAPDANGNPAGSYYKPYSITETDAPAE
jgi:hypothetical protein